MPFIKVDPNMQAEFAEMVNSVSNATHSAHPPYNYPKNKEEWWSVVSEYWVELLTIIERYAPAYINDERGLPIKTHLYVTKLKQNKDIALATVFQETWGAAPDEGTIHLNPAWNVLCDLCSENYVLFEE